MVSSVVFNSCNEWWWEPLWYSRKEIGNYLFSEKYIHDTWYRKVVSEFPSIKVSYCRVITQLHKCRLDWNLEMGHLVMVWKHFYFWKINKSILFMILKSIVNFALSPWKQVFGKQTTKMKVIKITSTVLADEKNNKI